MKTGQKTKELWKNPEYRERMIKAHLGKNSTHGLSSTVFYRIWQNMKMRCGYKKHNNYKNYGARGIKCEWKSFEEFRDDMYESYLIHREKFGGKNTTLDRIDVDGNYSKENCRWATWKKQNNNKRVHKFIRLELSKGLKTCGMCKILKKHSDFYKIKAGIDKRTKLCKPCLLKRDYYDKK